MKKKKVLNFATTLLLLILIVYSNNINAQSDTIPKVIFSEWRGGGGNNYVEITNIGDTSVNLKSFDLGVLVEYKDAYEHISNAGGIYQTRLPEFELASGQSYVIGVVNDYWDENPEEAPGPGSLTNVYIKEVIDLPVFKLETGKGGDSVSVYNQLLDLVGGQQGSYLEYHYPNGDSIIVDAVKNDIQDNGRILRRPNDVAGFFNATAEAVLIRKTSITSGNTDWEQSSGIDPEDSEWIVIPFRNDLGNPYQKYFTTIKHHGNASLNESSFRSNVVDIDFENSVITVPWGIYRDSLMFEFNLGKGLAWHLTYSPDPSDSLFNSIRLKDTLTMWAVGSTLQEIKFGISVAEPAADMNHVLPKNIHEKDEEADYYYPLFGVTEDQPGIDSITNVSFGLRTDTLFKYLEKPGNATWDIVWVDGEERPDLKRGDILRVTSENNNIKDYYIAADSIPEPSHVANLSAITWPDVPEFTKLSPQWGGDIVIPRFNRNILSYQLTVPYGMDLPALQVIPENVNAHVSIKRATNLKGSIEDRTTVITVTAEDDTTTLKYSVLFEEEVLSIHVQPFYADPIITKLAWKIGWYVNFFEVSNPGNQPLNLSNYLIANNRQQPVSNPSEAITHNSDVYSERYSRYVPGYDYVSEPDWAGKPGYLVMDNNIDPILDPGESFVIANSTGNNATLSTNNLEYADVIFDACGFNIADIDGIHGKIIDCTDLGYTMFDRRGGNHADVTHIYKITNDSILDGEKGIGDPSDFKLIEIVGDYTWQAWNIDGVHTPLKMNQAITRKSEFWKPDTIVNYSFGSTPEESQWLYKDHLMVEDLGYSGQQAMFLVVEGLGNHPFDPINVYKSTVSSLEYIVSDGYTSPQTIIGLPSGVSVENFLLNIIKKDPDQFLKVISGESGDDLLVDSQISNNDTLVVTSADSINTTKYALTVTEDGLSDDAVLEVKEGANYVINIDGQEGTIQGIPIGSTLNEVLDNITKPTDAVLYIVDENNEPVSLHTFNYDSVLVETKASHLVYFEVVAQDNKTKIIYQLVPDTESGDAYLISNMYSVNQEFLLISGIPEGTRVDKFMDNIYPNDGAGVKLFDKAGNERVKGNVAYDDKAIVTSGDNSVSKTYLLRFIEEPEGKKAYVISNSPLLIVNQIETLIDGVVNNTTVEDLLADLTPAEGAAMMVVNAAGDELTTGSLNEGCQVKVTSADGLVTVFYDIAFVVSVNNYLDLSGISVYPNPTSGELFISGLRKDCRISVISITGEVCKIYKSEQIKGGAISVEDQLPGVYFLKVEAEGYILKVIKFIKR